MSADTKIEWAHHTFNCWHGCARISPGCVNCLAPDTRVLTVDGGWLPIGSLAVGDRLLAFDEDRPNRYLRAADVENVWFTRSATVQITTRSGATVTCSPDHRWLLDSARGGIWREARDLRLGDCIRTAGNPNAPSPGSIDYLTGYITGATAGDGTFRFDESWGSARDGFPQVYWRVAVAAADVVLLERLAAALAALDILVPIRPFSSGRSGAPMLRVETRARLNLKVIRDVIETEVASEAWKCGWLAGFLDTDGCASGSARSNGVVHRWTQARGRNDYLERTLRYLTDLGFDGVYERYGRHMDTVRLSAPTLGERIRFVSTVQPALHRKGMERLYGSRFPRETDEVVALAAGPERDLVDITTSTRTFVAEGLATHNCYADTQSQRWGHNDLWRRHGPRRPLSDNYWRQPLIWNRKAADADGPVRVFCASMADVFEDHPEPDVRAFQDKERARLWNLIEATPNLTWMLLTKRPENVTGMVPWGDDWPGTVWLGVSAEDQRRADERIPVLRKIPAVVRFVSAEPLVGPVTFREEWLTSELLGFGPFGAEISPRISWVICGGESGRKARPMHPDWARSLRDQCTAAGVAYHFKQWGSHRWVAGSRYDDETQCWVDDGIEPQRVSKALAGRLLDGRTWSEYPTAVSS